MKSTIIFGSGIAGLTVAHELLDAGVKNIKIVEKLKETGGFSRSRREESGIPMEHSWRGYAPFYQNFRNISQRIPFNNTNQTVYDQLTKPIKFMLLRDNKTTTETTTPPKHFSDSLVMLYYMSKFILGSEERRHKYISENYRDLVKNKLTQDGYDNYVEMFGPGLGLDMYNTSYKDIGKFIEMSIMNHEHTHITKGEKWDHKQQQGWHVMNRPTSEAWIDPWVDYLKSRGVEFIMNTELVDLQIENNTIISSVVKDLESNRIYNLLADDYVVAINPYVFSDIIYKNPVLRRRRDMSKCNEIVQEPSQVQIAFKILFDESINLPTKQSVITFVDSEYNITLYPQERLWDKDIDLGNPQIKGMWSGTACSSKKKGKVHGLPMDRCSKAQFIDEIYDQIFRCEQLKSIVRKYNYGKNFKDFTILDIPVWYEWEFNESGELVHNDNPKWVTTTKTVNRPTQKTSFNNLFLSGAHTKTSVELWSMEGAVESGKRTVRAMGYHQIHLHTHNRPCWTEPFSVVDKYLYKAYLPNIVIIILFVIIIFIIVKIIM